MSEETGSKRIRPVVVAGAVAILVLAIAYASNVSSKAAYLTQRNHRILANLGAGVESRINHVARVFRTVREIQARGEAVDPTSFDLACYSHFGLHGQKTDPHDGHGHGAAVGVNNGIDVHPDEGMPVIVNLGGSFELHQSSASGGDLHVRPDPACLLGWLGDSEVFDHVALLDSSGRSSFQTGISGVKFREVPATEEAESGAGAVRLPWQDRIKEPEIDLAGSTYRVYGYPLTLDFVERDAPAGDGTVRRAEWELIGLVRTDRLWGEALRLHSSILSGLVYALFLAAFSWPFVRLWALGPGERLRPRLVILVCMAMTAATGLLTVAVCDLAAYKGLQRRVSEELRGTALEIRAAFADELHHALATARTLERELAPVAASNCSSREEGTGLHGGLFEGRPDLDYRHLEMIFWMDPAGKQCSKWSIQPQATPLLPVQDRGYFRNVRAGALLSLPDDPGARFALESVHSRNSGATLAVLGLPVQQDGGKPDALGAVALALQFPSLLRPVLPPARHAAVIDGYGRVLFHSRPERSGVEDFVRETEDAPELKAVLFADTDRSLEASYWGRDRQMYVTALPGVPWRLVVYQDKDLLRNLNLEVIASTLALFAIHLLLLGVVAGVLVAIGIGRSGSMLDGRHAGRLLRTAIVLSAVAAALALVIVSLPSALLALPSLTLPLAGLGLGAATLVQGGRGPRLQQALGVALGLLGIAVFAAWLDATGAPTAIGVAVILFLGLAVVLAVVARDLPGRTRRFQTLSLASLGAAALVALAVLPALGFLMAVQEERLDREVRRGQLHLAHALERRGERLRTAFRGVPGLSAPLDPLLCDDRDVHFDAYFDTRYSLAVGHGDGPLACPDGTTLPVSTATGGGGAEAGIAAWASRLPGELARAVALYLPVNDHLVQALLVAADPARAAYHWQSFHRTIRLDLPASAGSGNRLSISSSLPPVRPDLGLETSVAALGAILLVALALRLLDRRLLVVGRAAAPPACLEDLREGAFQRLVVVHPPGADLACIRPAAAHHLDLSAETGAGVDALAKLLGDTDAAEDGALVCIEGVEAAAVDSRLGKALQSAVEQLGRQTRLRVLLLSAMDPTSIFERTAGEESEPGEGGATRALSPLDRFRVEWCPDPASHSVVRRDRFDAPLQSVICRFEGGRHGLAGLMARWSSRRRLAILRRECRWTRALQDVGLALAQRSDFERLDPDRIPDLVRRHAGDHYHALWLAISSTQRHVLAQLAHGALVNPGQREAAERLAAWRLIVANPTLRPMSRSFTRFIAEIHDAEELERWEDAGASSLWRELRIPMAILFAALTAFLVITQRQFFDVAVAVVSAAAVGVPALLRTFEEARKWIVARVPRGAGS